MKTYIKNHPLQFSLQLAVLAVTAVAVALGWNPLASPADFGLLIAEAVTAADLTRLEKAMKEAFDSMGANIRQTQDLANNALEESKKLGGTIEAKTQDSLNELGTKANKLTEDILAIRTQIVDMAQKMATLPQGLPASEAKTIADLVLASDEFKAAAKMGRMEPVNIGSFHKTQIVNATGHNQPLVPDQRVPGIITPAQQRLYMRDIIPAARASSNLVQYASEASFTNNARPQGDASPGGIEGEAFVESAMTFTLANAALVTLGHWIPASRQILNDAVMLQGHLSARLLYGLKLVEDQEYLTGDGTAGKINGINNQATAFTGGATNQTILDTLLKAILQVTLSNYEPDAFVMHPRDWYNAIMLKDTTGRYLFADPQSMVAPRVWAKPVVPSQSQTSGKFTCGAFALGAQIWDLEDASVRISENVNDHFIRNLVAILAEERTTLTVYRTTAFVYGDVSFAG